MKIIEINIDENFLIMEDDKNKPFKFIFIDNNIIKKTDDYELLDIINENIKRKRR